MPGLAAQGEWAPTTTVSKYVMGKIEKMERDCRMVYNTLELMKMHTLTSEPAQAAGFPWLWATTEAEDEKRFTFWIGSSGRTTLVQDVSRDHVGVYGSC